VKIRLQGMKQGKSMPDNIAALVAIGRDLAEMLGLKEGSRVDFGWDYPTTNRLQLSVCQSPAEGYSVRQQSQSTWLFGITLPAGVVKTLFPAGETVLSFPEVSIEGNTVLATFTPIAAKDGK
jgi:hypothetical protein